MRFLGKLELFSRTIENRFVFDLFDLLLCGVIVLVILRGWRAHPEPVFGRTRFFLFLAFFLLGASFALGAALAGSILFFQRRLPEPPLDLLTHILQAGAWLLLAASIYLQPPHSRLEPRAPRSSPSLPFLLLAPLCLSPAAAFPRPSPTATTVLDLANLLLLAFTLVLFYRRPLGGRHIATGALMFVLLAGLFHLGASGVLGTTRAVIFWNLEQFTWSLSLFSFAVAIGEASRDLFDKVFVRLQIAFILLASLMILVITQTEKTEYLASIRGRSDQLAEFVRAHVNYFRQRNEALPAILEREDFLQRLTLGFGNLPELKIVRIAVDRQVVIFEIADTGGIQRRLEVLASARLLSPLDPDEYFLIHALPLAGAEAGEVEFYATQEFLNRHVRKRIILIFSLFTAMVALSTLMIGLVVRGASATIRQQAGEIEEGQRRLTHASKLAAIGELAAGVAHEINNPATTILSRATFLVSQESTNPAANDQEDLKAIVAQAERIAQITRGLLMFSRPQALNIKAVSIDRIINISLRSVEDLLTTGRIALEKHLRPDLPRVLADEDGLVRALENFFRNAIDAMPGGGTLRICTAKEDPWGTRVRLEIADTGIGIEGDNLGRIFDPFFTTKAVGRGTGLGLSIAHGIIKDHHGTISVESQPGAGTTFTIILPTEE